MVGVVAEGMHNEIIVLCARANIEAHARRNAECEVRNHHYHNPFGSAVLQNCNNSLLSPVQLSCAFSIALARMPRMCYAISSMMCRNGIHLVKRERHRSSSLTNESKMFSLFCGECCWWIRQSVDEDVLLGNKNFDVLIKWTVNWYRLWVLWNENSSYPLPVFRLPSHHDSDSVDDDFFCRYKMLSTTVSAVQLPWFDAAAVATAGTWFPVETIALIEWQRKF